MIGLVIGVAAAIAVAVAVTRSGATSSTSAPASSSKTATTPGYESNGGSLDGSLDIDAFLAVSPVVQARPADGQLVQVNALALPGGGYLPIQLTTVATVIRPDGTGRVAAKMSPGTLKTLIAQNVPGFASVPAPLQRDGVFVQFDSSKVWALGGMATS